VPDASPAAGRLLSWGLSWGVTAVELVCLARTDGRCGQRVLSWGRLNGSPRWSLIPRISVVLMGRVCPSAWLCLGWTSDLDCMGGVFLWVLSLSPFLGWGIHGRRSSFSALKRLFCFSYACYVHVVAMISI